MIKVLLKHIIYECCIDVLFDKIFGNFLQISREDDLDLDQQEFIADLIGASRSFPSGYQGPAHSEGEIIFAPYPNL